MSSRVGHVKLYMYQKTAGEYKTFQTHLVLDQQLNFIKRFNQMFLSHVIPEKKPIKIETSIGDVNIFRLQSKG